MTTNPNNKNKVSLYLQIMFLSINQYIMKLKTFYFNDPAVLLISIFSLGRPKGSPTVWYWHPFAPRLPSGSRTGDRPCHSSLSGWRIWRTGCQPRRLWLGTLLQQTRHRTDCTEISDASWWPHSPHLGRRSCHENGARQCRCMESESIWYRYNGLLCRRASSFNHRHTCPPRTPP